jgi:hypothetical protein
MKKGPDWSNKRKSQSEFLTETNVSKEAANLAFKDLNELLPLKHNAWRTPERKSAYNDKLNEFIKDHGEYIGVKGFAELEKKVSNSVRHTPDDYVKRTLTTLEAVKKDYKEAVKEAVNQLWERPSPKG